MAWNEKKIKQERKEKSGYFCRNMSQETKERILQLAATHKPKDIAVAVGHSAYAVRSVILTAPKMMLPEKLRPENKKKEGMFSWDDYKEGGLI